MAPLPVGAGAAGGSTRVVFIDLLRGWAVVFMIETHVLNATLRADLRTTLFDVLTFMNGLVAPSFIVASGMAYAITASRKHAEYTTPGAPLVRQVARLAFLVGIGYVLHLPRFSLSFLLHEADARLWHTFFLVDVLQLIGVTLLMLQAGLFVVKHERWLAGLAAGGALLIMLLTPLAWGADTGLPFPLAAYVSGSVGSLFPLFPWSAFLLAGVAVGYAYVNARTVPAGDSPPGEHTFMRRLAWGGLAGVACSFIVHPLAAALYPGYDYWKNSPSFVLLRLGIVILITVALFRYAKRPGSRVNTVLALMGRESLLVYVAHLMVIFGDFGPFNLQRAANRSLNYAEAGMTSALIMCAMYGLARLWAHLRTWPRHRRRALQWTLAVGALGLFLLAPAQ